MNSTASDIVRLRHILEAIEEIETYLRDVAFDEFLNTRMMQFACIKQLEIIGEAANRLSNGLQKENSDVDWAEIIGMRNLLVHDYFGIDLQIIWEIIHLDIPDFKDKIMRILQQLESRES